MTLSVTVMHESEQILRPEQMIRIAAGVAAVIQTVKSRKTVGPFTKTETECTLLVNLENTK